jgi:hypothetical protein
MFAAGTAGQDQQDQQGISFFVRSQSRMFLLVLLVFFPVPMAK